MNEYSLSHFYFECGDDGDDGDGNIFYSPLSLG